MKYKNVDDMDEQEREALGNFLREAFKHFVESEKAGTLDWGDDDPFSPEYWEWMDYFEGRELI